MIGYLLDTQAFSHLFHAQPEFVGNLLRFANSGVVVPSVVAEEVLKGWLDRLHRTKEPIHIERFSRGFVKAIRLLQQFEIVAMTERAENRYLELRRLKLNVGRNDLRIGALALELGVTVVTNNLRDFGRIPGLNAVDWLIPYSSSPPAVS